MATSNNTGKKPAPSTRRRTRAAKTIDIEANKKKPSGDVKPSSGIPDTKADTKAAPKTAPAKSADVKSAPEKPTPTETSNNFSGLVLSAILGGAIAVGGLGVIGQIDGADDLPLVGSLFAKPDAEKIDLSNLADIGAVTSLKSEIAALTSRLETTQEQLKSTGTVDISVIEGKIAELEQKIAELEQKSKTVAVAGIDEETIGRINDLGAKSQANEAQLEQLKAQISALKTNLSTAGQNTGSDEVVTKLAELESAVGDIRKQTTAISSRINKLEGQFSSEFLDKIENMAKISENAKASEKIARSVAVSALQTAIEQNTPYLNVLVSIETLSGPTKETSRLKELAASGNVPDLQTLQNQFKSLASQLIPATAGDENAGVLDKLVSSAKSLIKVRSSTPISGNTAQAIVSRIDGQLTLGNLAGVIEEWNGLPEASKAVGSDWIKGVKVRMETSRLLKIVLKQASEGLRG